LRHGSEENLYPYRISNPRSNDMNLFVHNFRETPCELQGTGNTYRCWVHSILFMALRPNPSHGLLILEVFYITHNDAPQSVRTPLDE
jgi:hypothetical protein